MKTISDNQYKNIVIIGGSHSGFSAAWLLLNGPASYKEHNCIQTDKWVNFPEGNRLRNRDCVNCNREGQEEDTCMCLGSEFEYQEAGFDYSTLPQLSRGSIKILYRDKIRVFYDSVSAAREDGYYEFNDDDYPKRSGVLYGYTGLRGDAKQLYQDIVTKEERRIKLIRAQKPEDQSKYVKEADIVIWACGY
jgi:hypothetical protein